MTLAPTNRKESIQVASSLTTPTITLRYASAADDRAIARLAALDSA